MRLVALRPILYLAKQYKAGDELPANDQEMVKLWKAAGTATWKEEEVQEKVAKATTQTAPPGAAGMSTDGNEEDLAGKITETPERERDGTKGKGKSK
jgi:hypothetical protein